jgi:hypothetical protein
MDLKDIESKIINFDTNFPPVDKWNPPLCEGPFFKIDSNGDWFYNNSIIKNEKLKLLFSRVLKKENNQYYLVTPYEKIIVNPAIAPYVITDFIVTEKGINLITNLNYSAKLDKLSATKLISFNNVDIPIVIIRSNIEAFFSRNVYYKLVDIAINQNTIIDSVMHINSYDTSHPIGIINA